MDSSGAEQSVEERSLSPLNDSSFLEIIEPSEVKRQSKHGWNSSASSNEASNSSDEVEVVSISSPMPEPPRKLARPGHALSRTALSFDRPGPSSFRPSVPKPTSSISKTTSLVSRPTSNVSKPASSISKPTSSISKPLGPTIIPAPSIEPEEYQKLISNDHVKRNFAGKMTMGRFEDIRDQTNNLIKSMHEALSTAPDEKVFAPNPQGLKIELMQHQKQGLAWLLWREGQKPGSGILADDMGLGKTLSMIALILEQKNRRLADPDYQRNISQRRDVCRQKNLVFSTSTLVVAPASLIHQWQKEVEDRLAMGKLNVHVYHGNKRKSSAALLAGYDIVITTYGTLTSDVALDNNSNSVLAKIAWDRIILDEAHKIKNRKSMVSRIACQLSAIHRWCLTGTPIQNELWDLFSLIRFMKIHPFHEEGHWKLYIMSGNKNNERLNTLIKGLLLRRTKDQTMAFNNKPILTLPKRTFEVIELEMKGAEGRCYQLMFEASRQKVKEMIQNNNENEFRRRKKDKTKIVNPFIGGNRQVDADDHFQVMSCLLALLLRLRQACVHLSLTKGAVDIECFKDEDIAVPDAEDLEELERTFSAITLEQDEELGEDVVDVEKLFIPDFMSTKVRAVLDHLKGVIDRKDKVVIVSQWTGVLDIIKQHLDRNDLDYMSITGQMKPLDRQQVMNDFNSSSVRPQILLLSLTAGGVGLNLTGGNHLFMIDLHWNPAMEQQAFDRIYRMGQKKEVFVKKFICKGTIEQRVLELQEKKLNLAKSVLDGVAQKNLTKLTMNDLKYLFDLDNKGRAINTAPAVPAPNKENRPGPSGSSVNGLRPTIPASKPIPTLKRPILSTINID
ncbi:unnamed protein product [Bursaphelenchus xylophilus]|uniref:(pine wood nematode) hypothetical protein n=1 Tax=Bursaphelenchus xylophilus TaxID=6326 RepID=A0A1I7S9S3_BURXY|nr:unnamed protein product [Bursaphelenchus xylophilus]CAG9129204.1 unnamed protein product [Bursaphelenchus xylophilus]